MPAYETTEQDVESYIIEKGWVAKRIGSQYNLSSGCPICGDSKPNHFYINVQGLWDCKKCGAKGNLYQLKISLGDISPNTNRATYTPPVPVSSVRDTPSPTPTTHSTTGSGKIEKPGEEQKKEKLPIEIDRTECEKQHTQLFQTHEILEYLKSSRGFKTETIQHFKLGWDGSAITIPIFEKSKILGLKKRRDPRLDSTTTLPKYLHTKGAEIRLFNSSSIQNDSRPVYITEGEFDAISLWQNGSSVKNLPPLQVVSSTGGSSSFKEEWAKKFFKGKKRIYICYDNDVAGKSGAEKVANILGVQRCRIVSLPAGIKDVNEFFSTRKKTFAEFQTLVTNATKALAASHDIQIEPISAALGRVKEQIDSGGSLFSGIDTGFRDLDKILNKFLPGNLIVVSGMTSAGKTFWTQNMIHSLARRDISSVFFSLEMPVEQIAERFIMLESRINSNKFAGGNLTTTAKELIEVEAGISRLSSMPIYFYCGKGGLDKDSLAKVCSQAVNQFGCQLIVVDHLHYLAKNSEDVGEVSSVVRQAQMIALDLEVPFVLISHIRKLDTEGRMPTISDLRNSSLIGQDAEIVIMLQVDQTKRIQNSNSLPVAVGVLKNRHGRVGEVLMNFDMEACIFTEIYQGQSPSSSSQSNKTTKKRTPWAQAPKQQQNSLPMEEFDDGKFAGLEADEIFN